MDASAYASIAYVTGLLKSLVEHSAADDHLADYVGGIVVSTLPPDAAVAAADDAVHLNLFLSHVTPNTRVRSLAFDSQREPPPDTPLAFDLHYVAAVSSAVELRTELVLGYVAALFQRSPLLRYQGGGWRAPSATKSANVFNGPALSGVDANLARQIGWLAIRPHFPGSDELSKLWSALQMRQRPSLSYRVELQPDESREPRR